ncbi:DNA topoisomerase IV [Zobellia laminariae]|uniref:DNA topoisomerase IV n=1 Tax=Zobellia laminariae TaxID=248906 RepID=UPI0026F4441A|nr:DNA topoisomerase IV [Zobellia laminariae]WKX76114.1 DNA topoisomerase IV [Zobellia laminariae]
MIQKTLPILTAMVLMTSCYEPERNCTDFKDGKFAFTTTIDGEEKTTIFLRKGDLEVDYFDGKADSSSVRWINDCEYVVKKLNPKNKSEEQSLHMKILSTTADSYIFEYNIVGESKHDRGTAIRTK